VKENGTRRTVHGKSEKRRWTVEGQVAREEVTKVSGVEKPKTFKAKNK
jgi:hypothetical protein